MRLAEGMAETIGQIVVKQGKTSQDATRLISDRSKTGDQKAVTQC
ncbi:hypothetical protein C8N31_11824 [Sulfitobacter mediterraneus]|jgi:hypothetical protein|uniref:Uncharacterized protein n=1 Tax=Sulfitobacter mediterraneus TaxID=83219 RepID=A0A2T6C2Q3_9RHOB|nr:hypothetical protein C8N31_11824 [Sulfitobacter mediterraneus]